MTGGLVCRKCGCKHFKTTNTIPTEYTFRGKTKHVVRRRKVCRNCGTALWSVEVPDDFEEAGDDVTPIKKPKPDTAPPDNPFV